MSSSNEGRERLFYIKKDEIVAVCASIEGDILRSELLIADFYKESRLTFGRPALIDLMELLVVSEGFLSLLNRIVSDANIVEKKDKSGYEVTEQDLQSMGSYSLTSRTIRSRLRTQNIDIDTQ